MQTTTRAADGGTDRMAEYLSPKAPYTSWRKEREVLMENFMEPKDLFVIHPHPEAWRWWMRVFGIKKPTPVKL